MLKEVTRNLTKDQAKKFFALLAQSSLIKIVEDPVPAHLVLKKLRDNSAKARILVRLKYVELGKPGDVQLVGGKVLELRIDYGPGYRIYFARKGAHILLLLIGGDKSTQASDTEKAKNLLAKLEETNDDSAKKI